MKRFLFIWGLFFWLGINGCVLFDGNNQVRIEIEEQVISRSGCWLIVFSGSEGTLETRKLDQSCNWDLSLAKEISIPVLAFPLDERGNLYEYPFGTVWNSLERSSCACTLTREEGAAAWHLLRFRKATGCDSGKRALRIVEKSSKISNPWLLDWGKILSDLEEDSLYSSSFKEPETVNYSPGESIFYSANPLEYRDDLFYLGKGMHRFYSDDYLQVKEVFVAEDFRIIEWPDFSANLRGGLSEFPIQ